MKSCIDIKKYFATGFGVGALVFGSSVANAASFELCAGPVDKVMKDGETVPMWGFALGGVSTSGTCATTPTVPGPALNVGTDGLLDVTLHNTLSVPVSIIIPGQRLPTDSGGTTAPVFDNPTANDRSRRVRSLVHESGANGGTAVYNWSGLKAGSHLYHSATHQQVQVQMGLYGAMTRDAAPDEAYPGVLYDSEVSLFYSEIDPLLHQAVADGCFGSVSVADPGCDGVTRSAWMSSTRDYNPRYYLVNGEASDGSLPITAGQAGQTILVRLFNAGLTSHFPQSMSYFTQIAENGFPLTVSKNQLSVALHALMTADVVVSSATEGTFAIFDRRLRLSDGSTSNGLMSKLTVLPSAGQPQPPVATDDSETTAEDTMVLVAITANDTADTANGRTLDNASVVVRAAPANGSITLDPATGNAIYTPNLDYAGTDQFTYTVADNTGADSNVATVTITITAENDAPAAVADAYDAEIGIGLSVAAPGVLANDTDVDGPALSVSSADAVSTLGGTVTVAADGSLLYATPVGATDGAIDSFTYIATDGVAFSAAATVSITLHAVPAVPPTANPDTIVTAEDTAGSVNVLTNDIAGSAAINPASVVVGIAANGTASADAMGNVTYMPNQNYFGMDSFTYTVSDVAGVMSLSATVDVAISAVNDIPVADDETYSVAVNDSLNISAAAGLLVGDTDVESATLTAGGLNTIGTAGTVVLQTDGSFSYVPAADAVSGTSDSFTYIANDGVDSSLPATVTINLLAALPMPPTATGESLATNEDVATTVNVLSNDTAGTDAIDPTTVTIVSDTVNGTTSVDALGNVTYSPDANFFGVDQFSYTVADTLGRVSNTAVVNITIAAINDLPVAVADSYDVPVQDVITTFPANQGLLANDSDLEGAVLQARNIDTSGMLGTVVVNLDGGFSYNATGTNAGDSTSFTYSAFDGADYSAPVTVTINIIGGEPPINIIPEAQGDTITYSRGDNNGNPWTFPISLLIGNDVDVDDPDFQANAHIRLGDQNNDGTPDTLRSGSAISYDQATRMLIYTPYTGTLRRPDRFWYSVVDSQGGASGEVAVVVRIGR